MFRFFSKNNMKSALDACQNHHKKGGFGQEMSLEQYHMIQMTSVFKDIDKRFKNKGLTKWGALAWLAAQTIDNTLIAIGKGQHSVVAYNMSEKMAVIALLIGNRIPELKLSQADMPTIENAANAAIKWLDFTETENDKILYP